MLVEQRVFRALVAALAFGSALPACDRHPAASAPAPAVVDASDPTARLREYTDSYGRLIGYGGLAETAAAYTVADIPHQPATASLAFDTGLIDQGRAALGQARAEPGDAPTVDPAADALLKALDTLLARLQALDTYYEAKSYRQDGLARGKREDAALKADFARALDALRAFNTALVAARDRQDAGALARLQAGGDRLGYATRLAVQQAGRLVALVPDAASSRDPRALAQADALAATLEATLAGQRQAYAAAVAARARAKSDPATPGVLGDDLLDQNHEFVARELTSVVGDYREFKQSHKEADLFELTRDYNAAVVSAYFIQGAS